MLDKLLRITALMDVYGNILTEKQRRALEMHYFDDLSLAEISAELNISRQAVHDSIQRGEALLEEYEEKLHILRKQETQQIFLQGLLQELNNLQATNKNNALDKIIRDLANYVNDSKEE